MSYNTLTGGFKRTRTATGSSLPINSTSIRCNLNLPHSARVLLLLFFLKNSKRLFVQISAHCAPPHLYLKRLKFVFEKLRNFSANFLDHFWKSCLNKFSLAEKLSRLIQNDYSWSMNLANNLKFILQQFFKQFFHRKPAKIQPPHQSAHPLQTCGEKYPFAYTMCMNYLTLWIVPP